VIMLLTCMASSTAHIAGVEAMLVNRGLTVREATAVQHRHRRRNNGCKLEPAELESVLSRLDSISLQPGQITHLLRSQPLSSLRTADPSRNRWCTYKAHIWCSCTNTIKGRPLTEPPAPELISLDCEFKPLRCAAVDGDGFVVLDCIVTQRTAGTSRPPLPGILRCDAPNLQRVDSEVLAATLERLVATGTTLIGHTPRMDLRALGVPLGDIDMWLHDGRVVDVAKMGLAEGDQVASLKRMATADGVAPEGFHASGKHCAVQDALVALAVYQCRK